MNMCLVWIRAVNLAHLLNTLKNQCMFIFKKLTSMYLIHWSTSHKFQYIVKLWLFVDWIMCLSISPVAQTHIGCHSNHYVWQRVVRSTGGPFAMLRQNWWMTSLKISIGVWNWSGTKLLFTFKKAILIIGYASDKIHGLHVLLLYFVSWILYIYCIVSAICE